MNYFTNTLMRKSSFRLLLLLFAVCSFGTLNLNAQCTGTFTIFTEDFEDNGNTANGGAGRYASPNDFYDTATDDDYWGRVEGGSERYFLTNTTTGFIANSTSPYTGYNGSFFYAGEDMDDTGASIGTPDGNDIKEIIFTGININGATSMCFSGLFARGENDACGASTYDNDDFIEVWYSIDGGAEVRGMCFNPDLECNVPSDVTNEPLYHDPNCDGDGGEGTLLTAALSEFTFNIAGTGNSLNLRISVHLDSGGEEIALDYLRVRSSTMVLPVDLTFFNAKKENEEVKLMWETASETNNDHFQIEHSVDGVIFERIGIVEGEGTTEITNHYDFMHDNPVNGINYYRLKQIDFNGAFEYSNVRAVEFKVDHVAVNITPNPFNNEVKIELPNTNSRNTQFQIFDIMGQVVFTGILAKDQLSKTINLSNLQSGVFILRIGNGENAISQRIIKL